MFFGPKSQFSSFFLFKITINYEHRAPEVAKKVNISLLRAENPDRTDPQSQLWMTKSEFVNKNAYLVMINYKTVKQLIPSNKINTISLS